MIDKRMRFFVVSCYIFLCCVHYVHFCLFHKVLIFGLLFYYSISSNLSFCIQKLQFCFDKVHYVYYVEYVID